MMSNSTETDNKNDIAELVEVIGSLIPLYEGCVQNRDRAIEVYNKYSPREWMSELYEYQKRAKAERDEIRLQEVRGWM